MIDDEHVGCPHVDAHRTHYTGTLCTACYREAEMRLPGLAGYCAQLRAMAAPGTVQAYRFGERVQESRGERALLIDDRLLSLADDLYRAATHAVVIAAPLIYVDPPYNLRNATKGIAYTVGGYTAHSVEAWLQRNLQWIVQLPEAHDLIEPLTAALIEARRAVNPSPPRRPAIRGACSICLSGRVTIEVRERGVFHSTCGGCGKTGPVHVRVVEAVLNANDGNRGSEGDGAAPADAVALSGDRPAAVEQAGP